MITSSILLIGYYIFVFSRGGGASESALKKAVQSVSVVICARNELENLKNNLPRVLSQDHPNFEVVVINDASWDGSEEYLEDLSKTSDKLEVVTVTEAQKRSPGKKMALTLGFKRARNPLFLLTDADCTPLSPNWIQEMTNGIDEGLVLGYSPYIYSRGFLNLLIRFDTWSVGTLYLSSACAGRAYMGVGRNMGYTREQYLDGDGFKSHYHIMSGDDDLLVNGRNRSSKVRVRMHCDSQTTSVPAQTWTKWFNQKKRHLSVSPYYTAGSKFYLGLYTAAQWLFYVSLLTGLVFNCSWEFIAGLFLIKTTIQLLISLRWGKQLAANEMVVLLPILEPILLFINLIVGIWSRLSRPTAWK